MSLRTGDPYQSIVETGDRQVNRGSKIIICSSVGLLIIYGYIFFSSPPIETYQDYFHRSAVYAIRAQWQALLWVPAMLGITWGLVHIPQIRRTIRAIGRIWNNVPDAPITIAFPIVFFLESAATSYWMLGATPRILDAFNYWFQARNFTLGQWFAIVPPVPECFRFPFIIMENGRWYGSVYPGYSLLLTIGMLGEVPWLVNPILGGISLYLMIQTGRELFGNSVGKGVSVLGIMSPFFRMMSSIFMAHTTGICCVILFIRNIILWIREKNKIRLRIPLLAGVALGFIYITRPQAGAVVCGPFLLYALFQLRKSSWKPVAVFFAPLIAAYLFLGYYNTQLTGDASINPRYYVDPGRRLGFGEEIGEPLAGGVRSGHSWVKGLSNINTLLTLWNSDMYGWGGWSIFGVTFFLCAAAVGLGRTEPIICLLGTTIFLNIGLYFFYYTPSPNFGPRYLAEIIPSSFFLTVIGAQKLRRCLLQWIKNSELVAAFTGMAPLVLIIGSWMVFLPMHTTHYGILPETLSRSDIPSIPGSHPSILVIPPEIYKLNVFTWNSPDLDGNLFIRDPGKEQLEKLQSCFPDRQFYRLEEEETGEERVRRLIPIHRTIGNNP